MDFSGGSQPPRVWNEQLSTRQKIMEASLSVFSKYGFHQTKMEDIAKLAGVAKGTLYYNFPSKAKLFGAIATEGMEIIIQTVTKEMESELPFILMFRRLVEINLDLHLQHRDLAKIMFNEITMGIDQDVLDEIELVQERYLRFIADILRTGIDKGILRKVNPNLAAIGIVGALDSLCSYYLKNPHKVTKYDLMSDFFKIFSGGMLSDEATKDPTRNDI
jgi:AcrR family transcriptional regulator